MFFLCYSAALHFVGACLIFFWQHLLFLIKGGSSVLWRSGNRWPFRKKSRGKPSCKFILHSQCQKISKFVKLVSAPPLFARHLWGKMVIQNAHLLIVFTQTADFFVRKTTQTTRTSCETGDPHLCASKRLESRWQAQNTPRQLTYPTWGKGKPSSKVPAGRQYFGSLEGTWFTCTWRFYVFLSFVCCKSGARNSLDGGPIHDTTNKQNNAYLRSTPHPVTVANEGL